MRKTFNVVTKAAIFSHDRSKVLVIHIDRNNDYGLPGGHINEGETMDDAIKRELNEECGIKNIRLKKVDFFMHTNGKIVLAYTGILDEDESILSTQGNLEGVPKFLSKGEFTTIDIDPNYRSLVLDNWK